MPTTPNYGFTVPDVLGSTNVWGGLLNDALGIPAIPVVPNIDTEMQRIDDVAARLESAQDAFVDQVFGLWSGGQMDRQNVAPGGQFGKSFAPNQSPLSRSICGE